jgi:hypothetical protein
VRAYHEIEDGEFKSIKDIAESPDMTAILMGRMKRDVAALHRKYRDVEATLKEIVIEEFGISRLS